MDINVSNLMIIWKHKANREKLSHRNKNTSLLDIVTD